MKLSVVIVSWNSRAYLDDCLSSILSMIKEAGPYEIIVVDNASEDETTEMLQLKYPSVRIVRNTENVGFARGTNQGIRATSGEFVALVNPDVIVKRGCLKRLIDYLEKNSKIGLAGPQILGEGGEVQRSCMRFPTVWRAFSRALALDSIFPGVRWLRSYLVPVSDHTGVRFAEVINGCFWMVRREALEKVGLLDEEFFMYSEDVDWCKRFWQNGWKVAFVGDAEAIHYGGGSSRNAPTRFYIEQRRANLLYWRKHHSIVGRILFFAILVMQETLRVAGNAMSFLFRPEKREDLSFRMGRSLATLRWLVRAH